MILTTLLSLFRNYTFVYAGVFWYNSFYVPKEIFSTFDNLEDQPLEVQRRFQLLLCVLDWHAEERLLQNVVGWGIQLVVSHNLLCIEYILPAMATHTGPPTGTISYMTPFAIADDPLPPKPIPNVVNPKSSPLERALVRFSLDGERAIGRCFASPARSTS